MNEENNNACNHLSFAFLLKRLHVTVFIASLRWAVLHARAPPKIEFLTQEHQIEVQSKIDQLKTMSDDHSKKMSMCEQAHHTQIDSMQKAFDDGKKDIEEQNNHLKIMMISE